PGVQRGDRGGGRRLLRVRGVVPGRRHRRGGRRGRRRHGRRRRGGWAGWRPTGPGVQRGDRGGGRRLLRVRGVVPGRRHRRGGRRGRGWEGGGCRRCRGGWWRARQG